MKLKKYKSGQCFSKERGCLYAICKKIEKRRQSSNCKLVKWNVYNVNFGHAMPRCELQYGAVAKVDMKQKKIYVNR